MKRLLVIAAPLLFCSMAAAVPAARDGAATAPSAAPSAEKIGQSVIDPEALTIVGGFGRAINGLSFQQDAVLSHNSWQYVVYYDGQRRVCLARRKLPSGPWQVIRFADYHFKSDDAHNTASLGICPADGTIHFSWDHHGDPLKYRVSKSGVASQPDKITWEAALFGPITARLAGKDLRGVTYPRFLTTPDDGLQFIYRFGTSGNGSRFLADYYPSTGQWKDLRPIDSGAGTFTDELGASKSRCSYLNGYTYGPDGKLHVTLVWREATQGANHDLGYAWSDDRGRTWRNNAGQMIGTFDQKQVVGVASPGLVVWPMDRKQSLMNTQAQAVDSKGRIHAAMWHRIPGTQDKRPLDKIRASPWALAESRYYHYWRGDDGKWSRNEIPAFAGTRPKLFFDRNDTAWLAFTARPRAAATLDENYNDATLLHLAAATAASGWIDWKVIHTEPDPVLGEVLGDDSRLKTEGILCIMVQDVAKQPRQSTPLRLLEFCLR